jgi:hypothetical protein
MFEKLVKPGAQKLGIERVLGEMTLSLFAVFLLLLLVFLLGLAMGVRSYPDWGSLMMR